MPAQRASAVQYFIYPLTAGGGYSLGSGKAITPANYWADALRGATDEWGLSTGYLLISPGDWVWAYFGGAVRQICGVGTVRSAVGWRHDWGRHTVHIRWDKKLTARLKTHPIGYDDYRQQVQGAAVRANPSTRRVFDDWLKRVDGAVIEETASGVKFAERAVTQRLGQPQFRAEVLRAYGGACAITGCAEASVLQAAHISPVAAGGTHAVGNAILLRADVHNLFDLGIITIAPGMTVEVSAEITDGSYRRLAGKKVVAPQGVSKSAFVKALASHRKRHSG